MKFKKLAGFGVVILFSLGMINQATSYTSAQVKNQASMRVVSSEKALIAIRVEESNLTANVDEILIPFTITNNMNRGIQKIRLIGSDNDNIGIENIKNNQNIPAGSNSNDLTFKYKGKKPAYVNIEFTWNGGSAIIKHLFHLDSSQINELLEKEEKDLGDQPIDTEENAIEEDLVHSIVPIEEDKEEQESKEQENKEQEISKVEEQSNEEKQKTDDEEKLPKSME